MAQAAALMILFNHIKHDLDCLDENTTLLNKDNFFITAESEGESNKQGTYLYFDTNDGIWTRSGKVTGWEFSVRHSEHRKYAGTPRTTSRFYLRYPSKASKRRTSSNRKGYFDNLSQRVAVSFEIGNSEIA